MDSLELTHPYLVHPRTGEPLRAVAKHPLTGRPVWPILGGDGTEDDKNDKPNPDDDPDNPDDDLDDDGADNKPDDDKAAEDARIKRANKDAQKYRTRLRETEAKLAEASGVLDKLRKAFGADEDDDPTEQATKAAAKVSDLEAERAALKAELLVTKLAPKHKANAEALLDSQKFTKTLAGLDPSDDDYDDQVAEAIKDAVSKNAAYRTGQGSGKGGSELDPDGRETKKRKPVSLKGAIGGHYGK